MTESPEQGELERRIVTVLFCDLAGFTFLSERLDAEDVAIVQAAYFEAVRYAVTRHGGTLEKFIGDAAVAVFGVPAAGENDAERAVRCGLAIAGAIEQLAARVGLGDAALQVRVGVNTGEAVVHPAPAAGEAMVTGDVVNTAARLQSAAPAGGVLVGPETALAVAHTVELSAAVELSLKGKPEPVRAAQALAVLSEPARERAMGALRAPTVGRTSELATLTAALEACADGAVRRLTVIAPPGTGKSRLLDEFSKLAAERGTAIRSARVRPDALSAFRPIVDLVDDAFASTGVQAGDELGSMLARTLGAERAEVVATELRELLAGSEDEEDDEAAETRRSSRFAAWSDGLAALGDGVEVWLVEDVHWSGRDFRAFLEAATDLDRRGRFIVCTSRPSILEDDPAFVDEGATLALEPLSAGSAEELVRALVGEALPEELVEQLVDRSGGNPLFVEELLRSWAGSGLLEQSSDGWHLMRPVSDVELPSTVQSVYAAQLDDLPDAARAVLRRASVAGRLFPREALAALGVDKADGVAALERRGIIRGPVFDHLLGECFVIRHALLRDVGYASLSRAERARLHLRMAAWLESAAAARLEEVAEVVGRHYAAALDSAPVLAADLGDGVTRDAARVLAAAWFERGALAALAGAAYDSARRLFERALDLTSPEDLLNRSRRLTGLARATAFTSDMAFGLQAAEQALALYRELMRDGSAAPDGAREEASRALALVGTIYAQQLRFHDVIALADEGLAELGDRDDAVTVRLLLTRIRGAAMIGTDDEWQGVAPDRARALELAHALGDPGLELEARMWSASEEPTAAGWAAIERLATDLRRWPDVAEARRTLVAICLPDDVEGTIAAAERLFSFASAHQLDESGVWADYYRAEAEFARSSWGEAFDRGQRALAVAIDRSYHRAAVRTWHVVVPIAAARRDRQTLERAVRWYEALDSYPDTPYGRLSKAGVDILFARAGLAAAPEPRLSSLAESFALAGNMPSWFESLDVVIGEVLDRGDYGDAEEARATWVDAQKELPSTAADAADALLGARLAADRGDADAVREAASQLRSLQRSWQLLKCLRLLLDRDVAEPAEIAEVRSLEVSLGIQRLDVG